MNPQDRAQDSGPRQPLGVVDGHLEPVRRHPADLLAVDHDSAAMRSDADADGDAVVTRMAGRRRGLLLLTIWCLSVRGSDSARDPGEDS